MMIRKFLDHKIITKPSATHSIAGAAFLITLMSLISRGLGLIRDSLLASTFSAGDTLDAYYAAFRIPDLIYNLLILGALSAAFIPVFTSLISREKKEEAWKMANGIVNIAMLFIIALSIVLAFFAPYIMHLITPGFSDEKMAVTVTLTRIMFLSPLFLGLSGIFGGILTSYKRFLVYSIAPLFYNIGIIIGITIFVRFWGPIGLAWGVVLGAFMHMMIQYPAAKSLGYEHHWSFRPHFLNKEIRRVGKLMIPRTMGIAVNQVNLFVITIFASTLASGSLAIVNFAQNLQGVALGLFGSSFAIAVFPTLSAIHAKKDTTEFARIFSRTFRQILFFVIPTSVFILLLRAQIVRIVLGHGKFDWEDTVLTFQALGIFSLSLFAQCLIPLLARAFYSMHDTKTPFYIALVSEAVNISAVLILLMKYHMGVVGLAAAFSLANLVQMMILLFVLRSRFENLDDRRILKSVFKIAAASVFAGLAVQAGKYMAAHYLSIDTFFGIISQAAISSILGLVVFVLACYIIKVEEFLRFKDSLLNRIKYRKKDIPEGYL
ncbi:MAG TPA: murein biosynthesis integral membrane protein MurJ [Patescibacteria group bacterium]|nr:murein biosynthesis integral membrane protein MurJ [Patescibacteria group bacterium]